MVDTLGSSDLPADQSESSAAAVTDPKATDAGDVIDTAWRSKSAGGGAGPAPTDIGDVIDTAWRDLNADHCDVIDAAWRSQSDRRGSPTHPTPTDVGDVVDTAWESLNADAGPTLGYEAVQSMSGDADRLRDLFENLFRNAADHGGDGVTVRVGSPDTGSFVENDGPGIPDGRKEAGFDHEFTATEDGREDGLSVARTLVDAGDGWRIVATDSETGGARFDITRVEPGPTADGDTE